MKMKMKYRRWLFDAMKGDTVQNMRKYAPNADAQISCMSNNNVQELFLALDDDISMID
jgi:hypothetical protein